MSDRIIRISVSKTGYDDGYRLATHWMTPMGRKISIRWEHSIPEGLKFGENFF
jgi:hypothetical protein